MKGTEGVLQKRNTKCYFFLDEHIRYWLQSDNTVKEIRNQFGSKLLITLAQAQTFRVCTLAHLKVGHTHEDVGAFLAVSVLLIIFLCLILSCPMLINSPILTRFQDALFGLISRLIKDGDEDVP